MTMTGLDDTVGHLRRTLTAATADPDSPLHRCDVTVTAWRPTLSPASVRVDVAAPWHVRHDWREPRWTGDRDGRRIAAASVEYRPDSGAVVCVICKVRAVDERAETGGDRWWLSERTRLADTLIRRQIGVPISVSPPDVRITEKPRR